MRRRAGGGGGAASVAVNDVSALGRAGGGPPRPPGGQIVSSLVAAFLARPRPPSQPSPATQPLTELRITLCHITASCSRRPHSAAHSHGTNIKDFTSTMEFSTLTEQHYKCSMNTRQVAVVFMTILFHFYTNYEPFPNIKSILRAQFVTEDVSTHRPACRRVPGLHCCVQPGCKLSLICVIKRRFAFF